MTEHVYERSPYSGRGPKPKRNVEDDYFLPGTVLRVMRLSSGNLLGRRTGLPRLMAGMTIALA